MKGITLFLTLTITQLCVQIAAAQEKEQIVRLANLVIDSTHLESYRIFLKEGIESALRTEPGVLTLYAVSEKENPTHFTYWKSMPIRKPTRHTLKHLIFLNTKTERFTWSNHLNW